VPAADADAAADGVEEPTVIVPMVHTGTMRFSDFM